MSDHLPELGLRDYFAAAALTGLVAADRDFRVDDAASGSAAYAALAYWIADAMLVRRVTIAEASAIPSLFADNPLNPSGRGFNDK